MNVLAQQRGGRQRRNTRRAIKTSLRLSILTVAAVLLIGVPFWMLIINSMKPLYEAQQLGLGLPSRWQTVENYSAVINDGGYLQGFVNSLLINIPTILLTLLLGSMAAWVFGRARTRLVRALYYVTIAGMLIPGAIVPSVLWLQQLHLYGDRPGLIVFYIGAFLPITIFLLTGFVKTIPLELEEAARIEGARPLDIYWHVILPLLRPSLAAASVLLLLAVWNDFFTPFFLLPNPDEQTLPLGLFNFASSNIYQLNWQLVFADVVLVSLPLVLVYIVAQRWIVSGLTVGAVKG